MPTDIEVRMSKKFDPHVPMEAVTLGDMGRTAARAFKRRIGRFGRDSHNRPLPGLSRKSFETPVSDPRFKPRRSRAETRRALRAGGKMQDGDVFRLWNGADKSNPAAWENHIVFPGGYIAAKRSQGSQPIRNLDLTGALWDSLSVTIGGGGQFRSGGIKDRTIKLHFRGSDKRFKFTNKKGQRRSLRMRDKARVAFYGRRNTNTLGSMQRAEMMRLSDDELDKLAAMYLKDLEVWAPR